MKKYLSVFLVSVLLVLLGGCSAGKVKIPLTVNGTDIDNEVFLYYLDVAFDEEALTTQEERINEATNQCIRYVAVNSTFNEKGLALSAADCAELSQEVNALWNVFSAHYENIGVSRETFFKIRTNKMYIEKLRLALYDKDGTEPIAEERLKEYFAMNYAAVKLIRGYLFTYDVYGKTIDYTEEQMDEILKRYNEAAEELANGYSIDFVYSAFVRENDQDIQQTLKTELIYDGIASYPEDFYERVQDIEPGKAMVYLSGDYIYLIYRVDISEDENLYNENREACLKAVSEAPLQSEINRMCNAFTSVRKLKVVNADYEEMEKAVQNDE